MAEYRSDPDLEPGATALCARRTLAGLAYRWNPGGDADAYVAHVGPEYLAVVDGKVYVRDTTNGHLHPHDMMSDPHIAIRPTAGDPLFISPAQFKTEWATVHADDASAATKQLEWELAAAKADLAEMSMALLKAEQSVESLTVAAAIDAEKYNAALDAKQAELDELWADYIGLSPKNDTPVVPPATDESSLPPGDEDAAPPTPGAGEPRKAGKA